LRRDSEQNFSWFSAWHRPEGTAYFSPWQSEATQWAELSIEKIGL
jgi:hypothetical protein